MNSFLFGYFILKLILFTSFSRESYGRVFFNDTENSTVYSSTGGSTTTSSVTEWSTISSVTEVSATSSFSEPSPSSSSTIFTTSPSDSTMNTSVTEESTLISTSTDVSTTTEDPLFKREEQLSDKISVAWYVDPDNQNVTFKVTAHTTGWVGFGISKSGGHWEADLVIGGVYVDFDCDNNETIYFDDRHVLNVLDTPEIDKRQDWNLLYAMEDTDLNVTTLQFWRKLDTEDVAEDMVIQYENIEFIWALGTTDEIEDHGQAPFRGTFSVNILQGFVDPTKTTEPPCTTTRSLTSKSTWLTETEGPPSNFSTSPTQMSTISTVNTTSARGSTEITTDHPSKDCSSQNSLNSASIVLMIVFMIYH